MTKENDPVTGIWQRIMAWIKALFSGKKTSHHPKKKQMRTTTNPTPPVSVSGKQFVYGENNTRFMVRGVALSATSTVTVPLNINDILANEHNALMTGTIIPQLQTLNANCIRVYQVDATKKHDQSMKNLSDAGIYVMVGLATPEHSIKQMTGEYSYATFAHAAQVVDEFQAYNNTLCFSVGNEVEFPGQQAANLKIKYPGPSEDIPKLTRELELLVAQSMKSFARDIKNHISANGYRAIPVGADMQDGPQSSWGSDNPNAYQRGLIGTDTIASYYTAGKASEIMDYIGINTYRYVTGASPAASAYSGLATEASVWPVPVILSETGGLGSVPRDWADVNTIYTTQALYQQLSGQVAFQMLEEGNGYGLYDIGANNALTATTNGGATALQNAFSTAEGQTLYPAASTPVIPTSPPTHITLDKSNPSPDKIKLDWFPLLPVKTYIAPNATITVSNYAANAVQVLQQGIVLGQVPAMTGTNPVSASIQVAAGVALSIQANTGTSTAPNWIALCGVTGPAVVSGCTVSTNVQWGPNASCNISGESAVAITVKNYANVPISVVQNGQVQGTVAAATATNGPPTVATVNVMPGIDLLIQGPQWVAVCGVSGSKVKAGITISNNVPWGSGSTCTIG